MESLQEPVAGGCGEDDAPSPQQSVRMTRRNTITSPLPTSNRETRSSKLRAATPVLGSPLRRSMRKRSTSITEDEQSNASVKVKPQQLEPLLEEDTKDSNSLAVSRVTRSQSRSPMTPSPSLVSTNKRKSGPASKANRFDDVNNDSSDEVEVTNLETNDDDDSPNKHMIIVLIDNDKGKINLEPKHIEDTQKYKNYVTDKESVGSESKTINQNTKNSSEVISVDSPKHDPANRTTELFSDDSKTNRAPSETKNPDEKFRQPVVITMIQTLNNLTPETIFKYKSPAKNKYESPNTVAKSVAFNSSDSENVVKSIYPKTPALIKSKSHIDMDSSKETAANCSYQGEQGSAASFEKSETITDEFIPETQEKKQEGRGQSSKDSGLDIMDATQPEGVLDRRALCTDDAFDDSPPSDEEFLPETEKVEQKEQNHSPKCSELKISDETKPKEVVDRLLRRALYVDDDYDGLPSDEEFISEAEEEKRNDDGDPLSENTPHKASKLLKNMQSSTPLLDAVSKQLKKATEEKTTAIEGLDSSLDSPGKSLRSGKRYGDSQNSSPKVLNKSARKVGGKSPETTVENLKEVGEIEFIETAAAAFNKSIEIETMDVSSTVPEKSLITEVDQQTQESSAVLPFAKSWTQSLSGKVDQHSSAKIDTIVADVSFNTKATDIDITEKTIAEPEQPAKVVLKRNSRSDSEDYQEEVEQALIDDDEDEYVEDHDEELQSFIVEEREYQRKEKPYKKRNFFDNEAMEADDNYESGDSMDEEERREIEENKILEHDISIGSEDTDEDDVEEEGSADSFIISDTEDNQVLLEYSDDDEHLKADDVQENDGKLKKKKFFKRIQTISSDSDSDVEEVEVENESKPKSFSQSGPKDEIEQENMEKEKDDNGTKEASESEAKKSLHKHLNSSNKPTTAEGKAKEKNEKTIVEVFQERSSSASASGDDDLVDAAEAELSVCFGQIKVTNQDGGKNLHSSYTIGVRVTKPPPTVTKITDPDAAQSSSEPEPEIEQQEESEDENSQQAKFSSEDEQLEKFTKINKLATHFASKKSRRQSLVIPGAILDDAVASASSNTLATKISIRRSMCAPSANVNDDNEKLVLNPTQSVVASVEERKCELQTRKLKRKRLSKSFSGDSMSAADNTLSDDVLHLHKKSKIVQESTEEVRSVLGDKKTKQSASARVEHSTSSLSALSSEGNDVARILGRCEQILEAADRAKLEAKASYKTLVRTSKKSRKRLKPSTNKEEYENVKTSVLEKTEADIFVPLVRQKHSDQCKENKKMPPTKAMLTAPRLEMKKKEARQKINEDKHTEKCGLAAASNTDEVQQPPVPKKKRKLESRIHDKQENPSRHQQQQQQKQQPKPNADNKKATDKKMKKKNKHFMKFELTTGTVSVEPATPKKITTTTSGGNGFRESPLSSRTVNAFVTAGKGCPSSSVSRKRKRPIEKPRHSPLPRPQWTQSGLFLEEKLDDAAARKGKAKKRSSVAAETIKTSALNFKQKQMFRSDIPRESVRAMLQRKQRAYYPN